MPFDKVIDSAALDAGMTATADAIRAKTGSADAIPWDSQRGFADAVEGIEVGDADELFVAPMTGVLYRKVMNVTENITIIPASAYRNAKNLEEFYAPNAVLNQPNSLGQEAFSGCTNMRIIYFPKGTYYMHYNFRSCRSLKEAQLGSIGYPVTAMAVYTFLEATQSDFTITVYVDAEILADIPSGLVNNSPWGATNATIVYRNSTTGEVITE